MQDRGEIVAQMEPLRLSTESRHYAELADLAMELAQRSAGFRRSLPVSMLSSLARLVRSMNCYYSNLIEGHNTHPVDIERALRNEYSQDVRKRNLQLEARAHIEVQQWIDEGGLRNHALSTEGICTVHRRFCELLPEDLLWIDDPQDGRRIPIRPGELRERDVQVGGHVAISPGAVPRFLARFEAIYQPMGLAESILHLAASHHRLLWIHPFLDGNGRVARLISHAVLLQRLDTGAIWSVARGLARQAPTYKQLLANCDRTRRNDLDGRGNLSEEALAAFTRFFLQTCIDQVVFMESLMQPDRLRTRILLWAEEQVRFGELPQKAIEILSAILYRGELPRGETASVTGLTSRQARRIVEALANQNVLASNDPREPLRLAFPAALGSRWMPGLFPENTN